MLPPRPLRLRPLPLRPLRLRPLPLRPLPLRPLRLRSTAATAARVLALLLLPGFALLGGTAVDAQAQVQELDPNAPLPIDPRVRVGTLDNGLSYYVRANDRPENRAELRLVVNAGSVLEEESERGLAHFVEHLAFRGTENFERQALVQYLESIGMRFGPDLNAYTSFDETVYILTVPTEDDEIVTTALRILEDWAGAIVFDPDEVDRERGVVIEEWRGRRGAQARIIDQHFPVMLRDSRYAERLPIGTLDVLETATADDLVGFYRRWYRPDLMAIVAVGDFDADQVEALIRERFAGLSMPDAAPERPIHPVPTHPETLFSVVTDPELTVTQVEVLHKQAGDLDDSLVGFRARLAERLYNAMLNDRLQEITQKPDAPFLNAISGRGTLVRGTRQYQLGAIVAEGGIDRGLEALLAESERVTRHGFAPSELERASLNLLRGLERAYDERERTNSGAFVNAYVAHFLSGSPIPGIEVELELARVLLPTIQVGDVNTLAREWITEADRVVLVSAPDAEEGAAPEPARLREVLASVQALELEPYEDSVTDAPLVAQVPEPADVIERTHHAEVDLHDWTLANGVRVLLKVTDFRDDEILLRGFGPGGTSLASDADYPSATFASQVVQVSGLGSFSRPDLQRVLAGKAASVGVGFTERSQRVQGTASPRDMETLFQLAYLHFVEPRFDPEPVEAQLGQLRAILANRSADPAAHFTDTLQVALSQGHPRARPISLDLLAEIDPEAAFEFYRDRFSHADDFTFVLVGNLELDEVEPLVRRYLGGLPTRGEAAEPRDTGVRPPEGVVEKTVRRGIEPRSQTAIIFHGDWDYDRRANYGLNSLAEVLRLRLREVLREDLGGTYGVQVAQSATYEPEERYSLQVSFGTDPERLEELVEAVFEELRKVRDEGPTADELSRVREIQRRDRETGLRQNAWWAGQITGYAEQGLDFADILTYEALIDALDAAQVQAAAARAFSEDRFVRVSLVPQAE